MVVFVLLSLMFSALSALRVVGPMFNFLFRYLFGISGLLYGIAILGLVGFIERRARSGFWSPGAILVTGLVVLPFLQAPRDVMSVPKSDDSIVRLQEILGPAETCAPVQLDLEFAGPHHDLWGHQAGLVLHLERAGYEAAVDSAWAFMLPDRSNLEPHEPREVLALGRRGVPEGAWESVELQRFAVARRRCADADEANRFLQAFAVAGLSSLEPEP